MVAVDGSAESYRAAAWGAVDAALRDQHRGDSPTSSTFPAGSRIGRSVSAQSRLAIVGSPGRGGFAGMLLGSVGAALLPSVECPIVVVHRSAKDVARQ
ncbi:universal stress protein [Nocardia blacklockiae]|uniref:universal stress protein n=1 Tax=Nocardia blacklockiae TaxID=480036 RepID=UPI002B4B23DD|nr:universal stress protein [Nocardia blacklockiae]